jgi:hypothetical protein
VKNSRIDYGPIVDRHLISLWFGRCHSFKLSSMIHASALLI